MSVNSIQTIIPADTLCNAHRRNGAICRNPAGFRTPHPGEGRCYLHGGSTPRGMEHPSFKHGQYSAYTSILSESVSDKMELLSDSDALDLVPEAQLLRALLLDVLDQKDASKLTHADIQFIGDMIERVSRVVEKASRIRNDTAITAAELAVVAVRLAAAAEKYVAEDVRDAFLADVFSALGVTHE